MKIQLIPIFTEMLSNNNISSKSVNTLIDLAFRNSIVYLRQIHKRIAKKILSENVTMENIAIDAIAPLFIRNENETYVQITEIYKVWQPPIETEEDADYFFSKIIKHRVEQHISFLLRESDPFFSRILDSVNYLIKKNNYRKIHSRGLIYIVPQEINEVTGEVISEDQIFSLPVQLFEDSKSIIDNLFRYIKFETQNFPAIPLNLLVYRIKELSIPIFQNEQLEKLTERIEINSIIENALENTFKKLNTSYIQKGKLSEEEGKLFQIVLKDMAHDLTDGGINPGLYGYVKKHSELLSKDEYKLKYHNILEYLLKTLKDNIATQL